MAEAILRLEEVSSINEICGHGVSKSVETRSVQASLVSKFGEPVTQSSGGQTPAMVQIPGEEPFAESGRPRRTLTPGRFARPPEFNRRPPQCEPAHLSGLCWSDLLRRCRPLDGEHPAVQVAETQSHQLPPSRTGVGGQADQKSHLLHLVQCAQRTRRSVESNRCLLGEFFGSLDERSNIGQRHVHAGARSGRPAHVTDRIALEDRFGLGPPESRSKNPKPPRHDGYSGARLLPPGHRFTDDLRPKGRHPPLRNGICGQRLDIGAGGIPRRWSPVVVGRQPPFEQIAHREERRSAPYLTVRSEVSSELRPTLFGLLWCPVIPKRTLHGPAGYGVDADGDADLKDSRAAFA